MHPSRHPTKAIAVFAASLLPTLIATAQVPETIHYQGKVTVAGQAFTGTGSFKFALIDGGTENVSTAVITANVNDGVVTSYNIVDGGSGYVTAPTLTISGGGGAGATAVAVVENGEVTAVNRVDFGDNYTSTPTVTVSAPPPATLETLWSHDGSSSGGSEPTTAIALPVSNGIFSVNLGDVAIAGMVEPISAELLAGGAQRLRVWFDDGFGAFELLSPDQKLASVPYALVADFAQTVAKGAVSFDQVDPSVALWTKHEETGAIEYMSENQGIRVTPFTDPQVSTNFWSPMIAMGHANNVASGTGATVSGGGDAGRPNIASWAFTTVGGGLDNTASGDASIVGGGWGNTTSGASSTVGGGRSNTASGQYSAVPGGRHNEAGGNYSFAAGRRAKAGENHSGTFIWADSTDADFSSTGANQFLIRAGGGVGIGTNSPNNQLSVNGNADFSNRVGINNANPQTALHLAGLNVSESLPDGLRLQNTQNNTWDLHMSTAWLRFNYNGNNVAHVTQNGLWVETSDERLKTNIEPLSSVLDPVNRLEVVEFEYKDRKTAEHPSVGFIAQDVNEVFPHLAHREDEDAYWALDYSGFGVLAIRAIQEQQEIIESQDARIAELEAQLAGQTELESRLSRLEDVLAGAELVSTSD